MRHRRTLRLLVLLGLFAPPASNAVGQAPGVPQPAPQAPVFRAGVDVLEVDVSVVDSEGRPIADLLGPEFTATVDGSPRRVVSAQFVSLRPDVARTTRFTEVPEAEVAISANSVGARGRLLAIAVDRESISFGNGRHAARAAARFLDTLGPDDKVSFFTVPLQGPFVEFTSDHELVRRELERMAGVAHRPRGTLNISITEAYTVDNHRGGLEENAVYERFCGRFPAGSIEYLSCELDVRNQAGTIVQELRLRAQNSIHALQTVLQRFRDVDAPKSLVWISEGLIVDGAGELAALAGLAEAARTTVNIIMLDVPIGDVTEAERSPTDRDDRELQRRGLELLAGFTRGALYPVSANVDAVFERMERELSGYYLLGLETIAGDDDGKRHQIKVSVRRRGATVRARPEFVFAPTSTRSESVEQQLVRALRSPLPATDLPMRATTYTYRDAASGNDRILLATEVDRLEDTPADIVLGFVVTDAEGKVVADGVKRATLEPATGPRGPVLQHASALVVPAGTYALKLAAIDGAGRVGSLERTVRAWDLSGVPLAVGDLMVVDGALGAGQALRAPVEARLTSGRLAAYIELYAAQPASFDATEVRIEVAAEESGPALAGGVARLSPGPENGTRLASAIVPVPTLRPGTYVARAVVSLEGKNVALLTRPVRILSTPGTDAGGITSTAPSAGAALSSVKGSQPGLAALLGAPRPMRRDEWLSPDAVGQAMDALEAARPALKKTTAKVRTGTFEGAARVAFEAGDQLGALFLRGLELFARGDVAKAGMQFSGALREAPDFVPAAIYLGACQSLVGSDRDAVATWRRASGSPSWTPPAALALGDALVRLGQPSEAVPLLAAGVAAWPRDDDLRRRLAIAYALSDQQRDALATIEPYLERHPDDAEALLVAMQVLHEAQVKSHPLLDPAQQRERMNRYAAAYVATKGPHVALVESWVR